VLDLAGICVPKTMQGRSLVPLLHGETPSDWRRSVYYHYYEFGDPHWVEPHYGIRTERYKLISYYNINQWELFDLEKDPDEMESVCLNCAWRIQPGYEMIAKDLVQQLKALLDSYRDTSGLPVEIVPIHD
jgi:hypothetical protein